jgi:hypothetical protein
LSPGSGYAEGVEARAQRQFWEGGEFLTTLRYQDRFGFAALTATHELDRAKIYLFKKIFRRQKKKKELFREFLRGRGRKVFAAFCRRPKCDKYEEAESCFRITTSARPRARGSEPKPKLRRTVNTPTT